MSVSEFTGEHDYRDVLIKAASLVEEGWCQDHWYLQQQPNGSWQSLLQDKVPLARPDRVCLEGAIRLAAYDLTGDPLTLAYTAEATLVIEADSAVSRLLGAQETDLDGWNDAEGRTADEVADALRRAAE